MASQTSRGNGIWAWGRQHHLEKTGKKNQESSYCWEDLGEWKGVFQAHKRKTHSRQRHSWRLKDWVEQAWAP